MAVGSVIVVHGLGGSWHVGSSDQDQTHVPALADEFLTTGPPGSLNICPVVESQGRLH